MALPLHPLQSATLALPDLGSADLAVYGRIYGLDADWRDLHRTGVCSLYQQFNWVSQWSTRASHRAPIQTGIVVVRTGIEPLAILQLALIRRAVR